jgi:hypothetical protein
MRGSGLHSSATIAMSIAMLVIGIVLIVRTLAAGGGATATGIIAGALFLVAGIGRLYVQSRLK